MTWIFYTAAAFNVVELCTINLKPQPLDPQDTAGD